ncbi:MAG: GspH/FimT family pseudopilin [Desulfosalsimonas sp.]
MDPQHRLGIQGAGLVNKKRKQSVFCCSSGFTLLELMIVIAIIAIVSSFAVAGLNTLIPRTQVKSAANKMRSELYRARMEAIKSNTESLVVFEETSGDSGGGFVACLDHDDDDVCDKEEGDTIISRLDLSSDEYRSAELGSTTLSDSRLKFNPRGMPADTTGGTMNINLVGGTDYSVSVVVSSTGRIRIE